MPVRSPTDPKYFLGDWEDALSAAGTEQSDATAVTAYHNYVTTVGAGSGVKLVPVEAGNFFTVSNAQGVNTLLVYPWTGASLNGATANDAYSIPPNGAGMFFVNGPTKITAIV